MTMTYKDVEIVIEVAKVFFDNNSSSTFCGCYEGDLNDNYPKAVRHFLDVMRKSLTEIVASQQEKK